MKKEQYFLQAQPSFHVQCTQPADKLTMCMTALLDSKLPFTVVFVAADGASAAKCQVDQQLKAQEMSVDQQAAVFFKSLLESDDPRAAFISNDLRISNAKTGGAHKPGGRVAAD